MTTEPTTTSTGEVTASRPTADKAAGKGNPAPAKATGAARGGKPGKVAPKPGATATKAPRAATGAGPAKGAVRKPRADTKQTRLIAILKAKDGATVDEVATVLGWQAHTVRGALYGALKKKGFDVTSDKVEGRGRVYRIGN